MRKLLVIDDDPIIAGIIAEACALELPSEVLSAETAARGLEMAVSQNPDLILLDLTLPDFSGLDLCRRLREQGVQIPVVCLTSRADAVDKIVGFENGADDYVTKPFNPRELIARIKAIWRRSSTTAKKAPSDAPLEYGRLRIDSETHQVFLADKLVDLSHTEFSILSLLAANPGKVFKRTDLLTDVLGYETEEYDHSITGHISRIRSKIEPDPDRPLYIRTVRGVGYRFATDEEISTAEQ